MIIKNAYKIKDDCCNRRFKRTDTVFEPRADQFDIDACGVKTLGGPDFFVFSFFLR